MITPGAQPFELEHFRTSPVVSAPICNTTSFMQHLNRRTLPSHVPRPGPHRYVRAPSPSCAPRGDTGALLPFRARRAPLLGVLHRPHPEPEHPPRLPRGRAPVRRVVRAPGLLSRPGRAGGGRGLRRGAHPGALAGDRQAAPRGAPDALRLARHRPSPPLQPRELGPGTEARRQGRQDPGSLREGNPRPPRRHRRHEPGGTSRPRVPRRPRLQLRARQRRGRAPGRRLLHARAAVVLPASREGRAVQRGPGPPHGPSLRRRVPRGRPDR